MNKTAAPKNFRPEIQALRALAVLLVVAYHFQPERLPGGYIGVDIFFGISGFLITGHLLREAEASGTISLSKFFAGRARRILPAAMLVILASTAATLALLPKTTWHDLGIQALASAFSVQNWVLAANSVDYLAAEEAAGPLQHFWSLAVEEQFYLLWPLLILAACRKRVLRRRLLWWVFGTVAAASLAYSIYTGYSGNPAGYFITTTRMWELAAGGLLALADSSVRAGTLRLPGWMALMPVRNLAVLAALASVAWAVFSYSGATVFPGFAAALPVAACLLVIAAGQTRGPGSLHRLVNWAPVQWVGLASYSLYLWHWPLLVFARQLLGREPRLLESAGLLAASLVLAWASLVLVEAPVRQLRLLASSPLRSLAAGALMMALAAGTALLPGQLQQQAVAHEQQQVQQLLDSPPAQFGSAALAHGAPAFTAASHQIVPVPADAAKDLPPIGDCVQKPESEHVKECEFGPKDASFTVALVGDSHAAHWFQAVQGMTEQHGWRLVTYLKNSCPFTAAERQAEADGSIRCQAAYHQALDELVHRGDVDAVITSYWSAATFADDPARGLAATWKQLEDAGIDVYPVADTPRPDSETFARDCVEQHASTPQECAFPESRAFEKTDATRAAAALEPRVHVLDFSDQFCAAGSCPAVVGNVLVYRDRHHITDTYMRTLAPVFAQRFAAAQKP